MITNYKLLGIFTKIFLLLSYRMQVVSLHIFCSVCLFSYMIQSRRKKMTSRSAVKRKKYGSLRRMATGGGVSATCFFATIRRHDIGQNVKTCYDYTTRRDFRNCDLPNSHINFSFSLHRRTANIKIVLVRCLSI